MSQHEKIDYLEFPAKDLAATKRFFNAVFGWVFADYGPDYIAFANSGLDGGFYRSNAVSTTAAGSALTVIYSKDLERTQAKIIAAGGKIVRATFSFPNGKRFHFTDPNGNEFAVWSDDNLA